jgi:hypothetical protein
MAQEDCNFVSRREIAAAPDFWRDSAIVDGNGAMVVRGTGFSLG